MEIMESILLLFVLLVKMVLVPEQISQIENTYTQELKVKDLIPQKDRMVIMKMDLYLHRIRKPELYGKIIHRGLAMKEITYGQTNGCA